MFQKKAKDHLGIDGTDEAPMYEDSVSPAKYEIYLIYLFLNAWIYILL